MRGPNAFARTLCSAQVSRDRWSKTGVIRLWGVEGRNARDQIAFCAFHLFLVEVQTNASAAYIHATHAS